MRSDRQNPDAMASVKHFDMTEISPEVADDPALHPNVRRIETSMSDTRWIDDPVKRRFVMVDANGPQMCRVTVTQDAMITAIEQTQLPDYPRAVVLLWRAQKLLFQLALLLALPLVFFMLHQHAKFGTYSIAEALAPLWVAMSLGFVAFALDLMFVQQPARSHLLPLLEHVLAVWCLRVDPANPHAMSPQQAHRPRERRVVFAVFGITWVLLVVFSAYVASKVDGNPVLNWMHVFLPLWIACAAWLTFPLLGWVRRREDMSTHCGFYGLVVGTWGLALLLSLTLYLHLNGTDAAMGVPARYSAHLAVLPATIFTTMFALLLALTAAIVSDWAVRAVAALAFLLMAPLCAFVWMLAFYLQADVKPFSVDAVFAPLFVFAGVVDIYLISVFLGKVVGPTDRLAFAARLKPPTVPSLSQQRLDLREMPEMAVLG